MIKNFDTVRTQLKELSEVINSYKSESVQLRLVDLIFGSSNVSSAETAPNNASHEVPPAPTKRRKPRTARGATSATTATERAPRASSSSRPGAKATLATLHGEGFFKQPRTISGLVTHCDANLASKFKQSEFSGPLGRYIREKKLTRAKNGDGQYEYTHA